jgi:GNAT superfamily N-acetyltransferase
MNDDKNYFKINIHQEFDIGEDHSELKYISDYTGEILAGNFENEQQKIIGKISFKLLLLDLAMFEGFNWLVLFDHSASMDYVMTRIMDFENGELQEDIIEFCNLEVYNGDICLIERIEIIDGYRGKGIGRMVVQGIVDRFYQSCGLFVAHVFPLQFESSRPDLEDWQERLNFKNLEEDEEKAFYQLKAFYQKAGFGHVEGYDDLMFYSAAKRLTRQKS